MLRITDGMMVNNTRRHLNSNLMRLDEYERQISSGKTISKPSDNPAGTVKSLRLRTSLMEGEQYLDNINEALSFMQTSDGALNDVDEIMQAIRQKTVQASTGTNDPDAFNAIAKEIKELQDQLKIIANATYGSKYIFAGTNVTEVPYENGKWSGNEDWLSVEIGVGVKADINIPQMKSFFMGRTEYSHAIEDVSGISSLDAVNLKEGQYQLATQLGNFANSNIRESQSYLSAVPNNKCFFYEDIQKAATLGVGRQKTAPAPLANDATYSGSLVIEVKTVDQGPHLFLQDGSNANSLVMTADQSLYTKNANGTVVPLVNGQDITAMFNMTPAGWTATYNDNGQGTVTIDLNGPQPPAAPAPAVVGNTIALKTTENLCNSQGDMYIPATATFDGTEWQYHGVSNITADISGHVYAMDGTERDIDLKNVVMNMEAEVGEAIFSIDNLDIDASSPPNAMFANDLIVWNNGTDALGGINIKTAAIKTGDKTILNFGAQVAVANAEKINLNYNFTDIDGKQAGNGGLSYVFNPLTMDNKTKDMQFYTMDQKTGVITDATLTFKTNTLGTTATAATFDYTAGLFGYIEELCGTIQTGKLPQVGNMLKGTDVRLQELLYHRSTIGSRINRLELQESRLKNAEVTLTDLLSKNEDTDEAKVIMELKMQENVYQASLAVGARIIQPTLIDYLN
ncbi:MAG: flagellar hook-associated protein FlgL [Deltaproteobacteria bacterium]